MKLSLMESNFQSVFIFMVSAFETNLKQLIELVH